MREANRSHAHFQVKVDDIDSLRTCFTGETVLLKLGHCSRGFADISVIEAITKRPGRGRKCVAVQVVDDVATQVEEDRLQTIGSTSARRIVVSVDQFRSMALKIHLKDLFFQNAQRRRVCDMQHHQPCGAILLKQFVIAALQERRCDTNTVFMQDGVPPYSARCVKQVLHRHFDDDRIISERFSTA
ncbi:hypothetical protein TNCV_1078671 [Trichonephila clavipes]|nr:hypothetical protein TNCV_1078671 [Trichonephila clavipes]